MRYNGLNFIVAMAIYSCSSPDSLHQQHIAMIIKWLQPTTLADSLEQICRINLTSIQSSRAALFEEFEEMVKDGVNKVKEDLPYLKIYNRGRFIEEFSEYYYNIKDLRSLVMAEMSDGSYMMPDFIFLLTTLKQYVFGMLYPADNEGGNEEGNSVNEEDNSMPELSAETNSCLISGEENGTQKLLNETDLIANPPLDLMNARINEYIMLLKLQIMNYIDGLVERATKSSYPFQDDDLNKLFEATADSLKILRNYGSLISKCQDYLDEYYKRDYDLCITSLYRMTHQSKLRNTADTYKNEKSAENNLKCKLRIDYMQKCNNALRAMSPGVISVIEKCNEMDQKLVYMRSKRSISTRLR